MHTQTEQEALTGCDATSQPLLNHLNIMFKWFNKGWLEQLEFRNSQPYYASKKIVIQSSDFPVRRTGSYRHKKSTANNNHTIYPYLIEVLTDTRGANYDTCDRCYVMIYN